MRRCQGIQQQSPRSPARLLQSRCALEGSRQKAASLEPPFSFKVHYRYSKVSVVHNPSSESRSADELYLLRAMRPQISFTDSVQLMAGLALGHRGLEACSAPRGVLSR